MPLSSNEQKLYDFARGSMPGWFWGLPGAEEWLLALVKVFDAALTEIDYQRSMSYILDAVGIWLDQHGEDRGLKRQEDEDDVTYAERIRNVEEIITRPALLDQVQAIMTAGGVAGAPAMVEMRRDRIFLGKFTDRSGTGGTFATVSGTTRSFTPNVAADTPVEVAFARSGSQGNPRLIISGAADASNNGTHEVTDLSGDAFVYTDATAAAGVDATVAWTLRLYDVDGNPRSSATGMGRAFLSRGYRVGDNVRPHFIVILPYGTTDSVTASVTEMLNSKKAAGVRYAVEVRANP